jgi:predicted nucleic acid-binding protein
MPKKSANGRNGAQRNKPKVQKSFELVRPERDTSEKPDTTNRATVVTASTTVSTREKGITSREQAVLVESEKQAENEPPVPTGSAAAHIAARRRAAQKAQQRNAASLITAEHFAYVRKDLITVAILAFIMFTAIIVLYYTIGRA